MKCAKGAGNIPTCVMLVLLGPYLFEYKLLCSKLLFSCSKFVACLIVLM